MGIRDDLNYGLAAFGIQIPERLYLEERAASLTESPAQNTVALVTGAAVLFYLAERGRNPKVNDIYDALVYCTTNISVGYCDIFAHTAAGKLIGSMLMTIGPSMAAKTLDGPKDAKAHETQQQILATLREIAAKLQTPSGGE
ncbi:MAG: ion channel [Tepidisphaeraceae bacterium]